MDVLYILKSIKMGVIESKPRKTGFQKVINFPFFFCKNTYYSNNSKTMIGISYLKL